MSAAPAEMLTEENRRWRRQVEALQSEKQALQTQVQELESIRRNLEHTLAVYRRCLFGSRSEKIDPKELEARIAQAAAEAQEQLAREKRPGDPPPQAEEEQPAAKATADPPADPADPPADPEKTKKRRARPHGRGGFPAHLPRRRIEHPVDPAQAVCAGCPDHPPLVQVGEDTCEKLVKLPVQYEVHGHLYHFASIRKYDVTLCYYWRFLDLAENHVAKEKRLSAAFRVKICQNADRSGLAFNGPGRRRV
jgi:hypothetical protein